ncbi:ejaculatory bulb-specific protein 3-like [Nylanderia fulva]|uniref:ejaculatory bulb-specific protein 3-like n=1 Tax=Nylanderia fulva TaxID=613905 RepID=UPI0010FB6B30|nr:ejaculatory bulb-specific protein 3-like [Nylanderia fulva]
MIRIYTIAIITIALICIIERGKAQEEKYEDKYDDVDVPSILANDRLREQYYKCFMAEGPCVTADAKFFSKIVSEAFQTQCKKCTDKQKVMLDTLSVWYTENQPEKWNRFILKSLEDMKKKNA